MIKIALGFCIKNNSESLPLILKNIERLNNVKEFEITTIFVGDMDNKDDSFEILENFKKISRCKRIIIDKIVNNDRLRTVRIAKARNRILEYIYSENLGADAITDGEKNSIYDYHCMIDGDGANEKEWNIEILKDAIISRSIDKDDWDSLSFNRRGKWSLAGHHSSGYYDIWALSIEEYVWHSWGYGNKSREIICKLQSYLVDLLEKSETETIYCNSAFNGFAIYRTSQFKCIKYDGNENNYLDLFNINDITNSVYWINKKLNITNIKPTRSVFINECCEHLYYHRIAKMRGCKIKISKKYLLI